MSSTEHQQSPLVYRHTLRFKVLAITILVAILVGLEGIATWFVYNQSRDRIVRLYDDSAAQLSISQSLEISLRRLNDAGKNLGRYLESKEVSNEDLALKIENIQEKHKSFRRYLNSLKAFTEQDIETATKKNNKSELNKANAEYYLVTRKILDEYSILEELYLKAFEMIEVDHHEAASFLNSESFQAQNLTILKSLRSHRRDSKEELESGLSNIHTELILTNKLDLFFKFLGTMGAIFLGYIFSDRLALKLLRLSKTVAKIGSGEFSTRANANGNDEISQLANSINAMAEDLESAYHTMQAAVTARSEAELSLRDHQQRLAESSRIATLGELAGGLAHELHQPLAAVVNYTNACSRILENGTGTTEELRDIMNKAKVQSIRASEIVKSLRGYVENAVPEQRAHTLSKMIQEVLNLTQNNLNASEISLRLNIPETIPKVMVDRIQVQQILLNLIQNAIDSVSGNTTAEKELHIEAEMDENAMVTITIRDNGTGSHPEELEDMFEALVSRKQGGLGLGLSISRATAEAHGGKLWATKNPDQGLSFHLTLQPAEDAHHDQ